MDEIEEKYDDYKPVNKIKQRIKVKNKYEYIVNHEDKEDERNMCYARKLSLYDRVCQYEFNSDVKYYSFSDLNWKPYLDVTCDIIVEKSINDKDMWVVIKLLDEMRDDIKEMIEKDKNNG